MKIIIRIDLKPKKFVLIVVDTNQLVDKKFKIEKNIFQLKFGFLRFFDNDNTDLPETKKFGIIVIETNQLVF